jgi:hypothetical protein
MDDDPDVICSPQEQALVDALGSLSASLSSDGHDHSHGHGHHGHGHSHDQPLRHNRAGATLGAKAAEEEQASGRPSLIGREVRLVGLVAKPELNGVVGVCERYDARKARYAVRLPSQPKPLALKGDNLELLAEHDGGEDDV